MDAAKKKNKLNKNENFFNHLFDSKNHPKYVTEHSSKQECETAYQESQVQSGYILKYEYKGYVESMLVANPPAVNSEMPLSELQRYSPPTPVKTSASAPE